MDQIYNSSGSFFMLTEYVAAAMRKAKYKILKGGEGFFGEIPACKGAWANAHSLEACREELREVLEDWLLVRLRRGLSLPVIDGINLNRRGGRRQKVA
jgi:predicted RNase H-like HicB family nuclease